MGSRSGWTKSPGPSPTRRCTCAPTRSPPPETAPGATCLSWSRRRRMSPGRSTASTTDEGIPPATGCRPPRLSAATSSACASSATSTRSLRKPCRTIPGLRVGMRTCPGSPSRSHPGQICCCAPSAPNRRHGTISCTAGFAPARQAFGRRTCLVLPRCPDGRGDGRSAPWRCQDAS
jgi:hypothetical protein